MRCAYVNGRYVPLDAAQVNIEDRGYQFADGVYEVMPICDGRLVDQEPHLARLARSLAELRMTAPMPPAALKLIMAETVRRNRIVDGTIYLQITRGVASRDHAFPRAAQPSLVVVAKPFTWPDDSEADAGVSVVSVPEMRWARRDIKSIALLPNILAKQQAREAGAFEAWFVAADGAVLEGASTNAWMIDAEGRAITHPLGPQILAGVTRASVIRFAEEAQIKVIERPFSLVEAKRARELFLTSTTSLLRAVVRLDGTMIGDGRPGPLARQLRARCLQHYRMRLAHGA